VSGSSAVFDGVRSAIVSTFKLDQGAAIDRDTTSADVAGWDSLSHSLLLMAIEDHFGIELPLDRVYEAANVGELVDLVAELKAGA
jgi:acyl carrier protein